ncbi:redox-regulated ATPase YchF [Candidatus Babeliales bacterium]|nr:redox-regulated ATPase YchF [Candidatus Babeliales bacterium]
MSIRAGLVGLPNVGKSTLFNALTKSSVPAENYPFCTIDPHMAITNVPDTRLDKLQAIFNSQKLIPSTVSFVDIAGLVKGAAAGEGLGNAFLSNIREVDLILHVIRCFESSNVTNTQTEIDPLGDYEIIVSELILKDLESIEKRIPKVEGMIKKTQTRPAEQKGYKAELEQLTTLRSALDHGDIEAIKQAFQPLSTLNLLSAKKFMIIANISEQDIGSEWDNPHVQTLVKTFGKERVIPVCAKIEHELSQLPEEEAHDMMAMFGLEKPGLETIIQKTYHNLGLITFFTCGPKEAHAWPIPQGITVRKAAGEIHSDLERGFICAEVFNCEDLFSAGTIVKLKELGKIKTEGQDYIVKDGDLLDIRFNV